MPHCGVSPQAHAIYWNTCLLQGLRSWGRLPQPPEYGLLYLDQCAEYPAQAPVARRDPFFSGPRGLAEQQGFANVSPGGEAQGGLGAPSEPDMKRFS